MIEVALTAGMAAFAVTTAIVETDLFSWYRRWGTWASKQRWWLYILHLPIIASKCATCLSLWAAIPFALLACNSLNEFLLLWFGAAGISILFYAILVRLDSSDESLEHAVQQHLKSEEGAEPPAPFNEAYNQTGDETS